MSSTYTAFGYFIVFKKDKEAEQTASGLYIPSAIIAADEADAGSGVILSIGEAVTTKNIKIGDVVYFRRTSGKIDNEHFVAHQDDILCVKN